MGKHRTGKDIALFHQILFFNSNIDNFDNFLSVFLLNIILELKLKTAGFSIDTVINDERLATNVQSRSLTTV